MKSKKFDAEFKKDIAKLYLNGSRSCESLANEIGVHSNTIYKWIRLYNADPGHAFPGSGNLQPDEVEVRKASRHIHELENEDAILKQAAVYFAKNRR